MQMKKKLIDARGEIMTHLGMPKSEKIHTGK
jgi:hypothetical protein